MDTNKLNERRFSIEPTSGIWSRRIQKVLQRTEKPKYPFGLPELDQKTHGITKGKVTIVAGRASEAKTSFALQSAFNAADAGGTVIYITLEDDAEQIVERLFCNLRGVDNQEMIKGRVPKHVLEDPAIEETFTRVKFATCENYGHNFREIQEIIETIEPKPDLVFLDYVQLIEQLPRESEYEALSHFSQN